MSRVVVLGGSGAMGAQVCRLLRERGNDVLAASRATGVDVCTGAGLEAALSGADTVVDCLNVVTMSRRTAVSFFAGAATRVSDAAATAGVGHIVCLSIVNVTDPTVRRLTGYYAGKAAQEQAYAAGPVPLTLARTTAWFSLAETFLSQIRLGPLALVPGLALQPRAPARRGNLRRGCRRVRPRAHLTPEHLTDTRRTDTRRTDTRRSDQHRTDRASARGPAGDGRGSDGARSGERTASGRAGHAVAHPGARAARGPVAGTRRPAGPAHIRGVADPGLNRREWRPSVRRSRR